MPLPLDLRTKIESTIQSVLLLEDLRDFTRIRRELLGCDFDSHTNITATYPLRIKQYINELEKKGTLVYFMKELANEYTKQPLIQNFYNNDFKSFFNVNSQSLSINAEYLDCILLENSLPFIDRDNIKDALQRLINEQKTGLLLIDGKTKSGLSYVRWYLKEMARRTNDYQFEYIDMKYILNKILKNQSRIHAYDVAEYLSDKLVLKYNFDKDKKDIFKITPFINHMKEEIKKKKCNLMLYFDHFDSMVNEDVSDLIYEIVETSLLSNLNCYIFLAGYKDMNSWSPDIVSILKSKYNNVVIGSFTEDHLRLFFKKMHSYLSVAYTMNTTEDEFISNILNQIPKEYFEEPNVESIGIAVKNWYQEFQNKNP